MGDHDYERAHKQELARDDVDRVLDAVLASYAAVEPRAGLEQRVLANLRAEQAKPQGHSWWRWSAAAALAAIVGVAVVLAGRPGRPSHSTIANHPPTTTLAPAKPATQIASNNAGNTVLPQGRRPVLKIGHHPRSVVVTAAQPKLDHFPSQPPPNQQEQFPSPRPLSEQERILASYVAQFPEKAALIARAQTALLERERQEELEKYGPPPAGAVPQDRRHLNNPNL